MEGSVASHKRELEGEGNAEHAKTATTETQSMPLLKKQKRQKGPAVAIDLVAGNFRPTLADIKSLLLRTFTSEYGENAKWVNVKGMGLIRSATVVLVPCLNSSVVRAHALQAPTLASLLDGSGFVAMRSAGEVHYLPAKKDTLIGCRLSTLLLSARAKPAVTNRKAQGAAKPAALGPRLPVKSFLASTEEKQRSDYPTVSSDGWVSTKHSNDPASAPPAPVSESPADDPDLGRLVGVDCEMVKTKSGLVLARVSAVNASGELLYDSLVRPDEEVIDYVTEFSGITEEMLEGVETTLADVQTKLLELLTEQSVLVGHSLENDLRVLKLLHERVIDTSLLYPHPNGWPQRQSLKHLVTTILKRKLDRTAGHDSVADARAALDLALLKIEKGPGWGVISGEAAPLGRLLKTAGTSFHFVDSGPLIAEPTAAWHLDCCEPVAVEDDSAAVTATLARTRASAADGAPRREVRAVVLRGFEAHCQATAASPDADESVDATRATLVALDGHVAQLAGSLATGNMLVLLSGCGNVPRVKHLEAQSPCGSSVALLKDARWPAKESFGVLAVGGPELCQELESARLRETKASAPASAENNVLQRELASYDL